MDQSEWFMLLLTGWEIITHEITDVDNSNNQSEDKPTWLAERLIFLGAIFVLGDRSTVWKHAMVVDILKPTPLADCGLLWYKNLQ